MQGAGCRVQGAGWAGDTATAHTTAGQGISGWSRHVVIGPASGSGVAPCIRCVKAAATGPTATPQFNREAHPASPLTSACATLKLAEHYSNLLSAVLRPSSNSSRLTTEASNREGSPSSMIHPRDEQDGEAEKEELRGVGDGPGCKSGRPLSGRRSDASSQLSNFSLSIAGGQNYANCVH